MTSNKGGVRSDATVVGSGPVAFSWTLGTVCGCAQPPRNGMSEGGTGRMVNSSFSF